MLVLKGLVGLHRIVQLRLPQRYWYSEEGSSKTGVLFFFSDVSAEDDKSIERLKSMI